MSARLNFNEIPYFSWKDKIFYQISSFIKQNSNTGNSVKLFMNSQPLKLYRREIASTELRGCKDRVSLKIDDFDRPGSMIVTEDPTKGNSAGLVNIIDYNITECISINKDSCINMPDMDARRRVRSAGMIQRKYNVPRNNDTYCTSTNQYLVSRNRTFSQNQYNFIRQGNSSIKPGSALSKDNLYSPNGISHCKQPYISSQYDNNIFSYQWIDGQSYNVTLPDGQYDIFDLNNYFQNVMIKNTHYFIKIQGNINIFLLNITYDNLNKKVILQVSPKSDYSNTNNFTIPYSRLNNWNLPGSTEASFIIPNTNIQNIFGFTSGTYNQSSQTSNIKANINQTYVTMNYKPNNPEFGQQGAVSSSTLIARKKFDVITDVGGKMKAAYGNATANAYAYSIKDSQYTLKDKIGYPLTKTPVISKYTGEVKCVDSSLRQSVV
jgi:hypothetical protein